MRISYLEMRFFMAKINVCVAEEINTAGKEKLWN